MYIYIDCFTFYYDLGYNQVTKSGGLPLSKFCCHHFTFHGDILYVAYIVSPYGHHACGVVSYLKWT